MEIKEILPTRYFVIAMIFTISLVVGFIYKLGVSYSVLEDTQKTYIPVIELSAIVLKVDEQLNHLVFQAAYENASEKKRKKIYMSQTEIQKLINQKKDDIQNEAEVDEDSENEITDESELS